MTEIPTMSTHNNISVMHILNNISEDTIYTIISLFVHSEQVMK